MRDLLQLGLGNALTAAALAAGVLLVTRIWRQPQVAWCLWTLVLLRLLAPPLLAFPVRLDGLAAEAAAPRGQIVAASQSFAEVYAETRLAAEGSQKQPQAVSAFSQGVEIFATPAKVTQPGTHDVTLHVLESLAVVVWLGGSLMLATIIAIRVARFHRLVLRTPRAEAALQQLANECARQLNLRRSPEVRIVAGRIAPLVWTLGRRARVLLPAALVARLSREQTTTILTHELAHLRRRDPWMRWFETLAVVLHWWNPVAWRARAWVQQAEEECCDALVLCTLPGHAHAYAAALLETVQFLSEGQAPTPMLASGFGRVHILKRRFEMILQGSRRRLSWKGRLALLIAIAATIPFSAYAVWGEEGEPPQSFAQRLERLERLVEKLLQREEQASAQTREEQPGEQDADERRNGENHAQSGDVRNWGQRSQSRRQWLQEQGRRLSPADMRIHEALKKPVEVRFSNRPLSEVLETLSAAVGVNFQVSEHWLRASGVATDVPIDLQLREPVTLRSALNLILEPLNLTYVIRNEVVEITTEAGISSAMFTKVYSVADLVVPVPGAVFGTNAGPAEFAAWTLWSQQQASQNRTATAPVADANQPDFGALIETITSTVAPTTWDAVGGAGAIQPSPVNLSLVVSQSEAVHEQIADLLEQMRRQLEVQIAIETRFLAVSEEFWEELDFEPEFSVQEVPAAAESDINGVERIGVEFELQENRPNQATALAFDSPRVLSHEEMRQVMAAAQDREPTNPILAAPKLTLFNGQRAFVHIESVVAGDENGGPLSKVLARRKTPVSKQAISLGLQGVVSADRRSVRLSVAALSPSRGPEAPATEGELTILPHPAPAVSGPTVTANIGDGHTMLVDGGELPASNGRISQARRLLLLITPRVLVAQEEENKLGVPVD